MQNYHDTEWGVPIRDSRALWEKLILDGFQAGLSWRTILLKRDAFREAFDGFVPECVAEYDATDIARLLGDKTIVRSRIKIKAAIRNANAYVSMKKMVKSLVILSGMRSLTSLCTETVLTLQHDRRPETFYQKNSKAVVSVLLAL